MPVRSISHEARILRFSVDHQGSTSARVCLNEGLVLDIVVLFELGHSLVEVQSREVVAWAAKDTVTSGSLVSNVLEILGALKQSCRRNVILKSILSEVC